MTGQEIAVVGMACLLPGARSPEELWRLLTSGGSALTPADETRFGTSPEVPGGWGDPDHHLVTTLGGWVDDLPLDLGGLHLPEDQLAREDRVVRWPLAVARAALRDAGVDHRDHHAAGRTGLVLGDYSFPTANSVRARRPLVDRAVAHGLRQAGLGGPVPERVPPRHPGAAPGDARPLGQPAAVLARALGLGGPRLGLDAACASALYCVALARDYLLTGAADTMLAGAVCAPDELLLQLSFSDLGAYPRHPARSQPFDADSEGIVTGQGAGVLVLRRLEDAVRDGDRVLGVLEAVGLAGDGAGRHPLRPRMEGQLAAYRAAYAQGPDPTTVDYLECHATGTPLGDRTEMSGIATFFGGAGRLPEIGSVKGQLGHLLTVAGFSSLAKVLLAFRHDWLPPTPGVVRTRRPATAEAVADRVLRIGRSWTAGDRPRRAAVSAFGFGGINAHLVLRDHPRASPSGPGGAGAGGTIALTRALSTGRDTTLGEDDRTRLPDHDPCHRDTEPGGGSPASTPPATPHPAGTPVDHEPGETRSSETGTPPGPEPATTRSGACPRLGITGLGIRLGELDDVRHLDALLRGIPRPARPATTTDHGGPGRDLPAPGPAYRIPPGDLRNANPQHLAAFAAADQALDDAGYPCCLPGHRPEPRRVAVIGVLDLEPDAHRHRDRFDIGARVRAECHGLGADIPAARLDELERAVRDAVHEPLSVNEVLSYVGSVVVSRIAASRNLTGPAFTLSADDTAGARAVEVAGLLLRDPTVEAVLLVDVDPAGDTDLARGSEPADDPGPGRSAVHGAAAVVLVRAEDETTRHYAVIRSVAIRHLDEAADEPGRATSDAASLALRAAGVPAEEIDHVELGGWTERDRTVEAQALSTVLRAARPSVGALGPSTGVAAHAMTVAALVGLAWSLHRAELPGAPSDLGGVPGTGFVVPGRPRPWLPTRRGERRFASLSVPDRGTGAAHLVLSDSERPRPRPVVEWDRGGRILLRLTGDTPEELVAHAAACRRRLAGGAPPRSVARTATSLPARRHRAVLVAVDAESLHAELLAAERDLPTVLGSGGEWATPAGSYATAHPIGPAPVAFVYPGAFTGYPGLGNELFRMFPRLRQRFEREAEEPRAAFRTERLFPAAEHRLTREELLRHEADLLSDIPSMLVVGTNMAVLHTQLLRDELGLTPDGGIGYSLGESSMLFATGVWDHTARDDHALTRTSLFRDGLRGRKQLVRDQWQLGDEVEDDEIWSTHVLLTRADLVRHHLDGLDRVFLTHVNSPTEVVVAGDPRQCRLLVERLGVSSARAPANHVMHCPLVAAASDELVALNTYPSGEAPARIRLFGTGASGPLQLEAHDAASHARRIAAGLAETVDFAGLTESAYREGFRYFVEVGPGATCTRWVSATLAGRDHLAVSVDRRGAPAGAAIAAAVARLAAHGVPIRLDALTAGPPDPTTADRPAGWPERVPRQRTSLPDRIARAARAVLAAPSTDTGRRTKLPEGVALDRVVPVPVRSEHRTPVKHASAGDDEISMERTPFVQLPDPEARPRPAGSTPCAPSATGHPPAHPETVDRRAHLLGALAAQVAEAHHAALRAQGSLQALALRALTTRQDSGTLPLPTPGPVRTGPPAAASPASGAAAPPEADEVRAPLSTRSAAAAEPPPGPPSLPRPTASGSTGSGPVWNHEDLVTFAEGRLHDLFGPAHAEADTYRRRLRLPARPYLLISRVTSVEGTPGALRPCRITTEYDVPDDGPFTVDGSLSCAVAIEAGQGTLLLLSLLGADALNRGERGYRLLDSTAVFHDRLPRAGQTLRYEITIDRFVRDGETLLFSFRYRCYSGDALVLELRRATAGFFRDAELDGSTGLSPQNLRRALSPPGERGWFKPIARTDRCALNRLELERLAAPGGAAAVFGAEWDQGGANPSVRLPGPDLLLLDEVTAIERTGGSRGLGEVRAVLHHRPDSWYFAAHFPDDPVLPGSLLTEAAVQIVQVYALFLGLHLVLPDAEFQPVPGLETTVSCRGQVTPGSPPVRYRVDVTTLTLLPRPTVVADVVLTVADRVIGVIHDLGIRLREKPGTPYRPERGGHPAAFLGRRNALGQPAVINELHLAHAARGDLETAMGPEFAVHRGRRAPHIPNGDFQFVDRVMALEGVRGSFTPGSRMRTEYDSPLDAWYYQDGATPDLPHCVCMETALQAAILLGYYLGATLGSADAELSIRNLEGEATLVADLDTRGRTISHSTELLSHEEAPGAVLQSFRFELSVGETVFYTGRSLFGYFTRDALARQVGLDAGRHVPTWLDAQEALGVRPRWVPVPDTSSDTLGVGTGRLRALEGIEVVDGGGVHGRGYLRGRRRVSPDDWYFSRHFHQDPVMPGSIGVEAVLQGLRIFVLDSGLTAGMRSPRFALPVGRTSSWKYRGQVLPEDGELLFEAHVKDVRRLPGRLQVVADASVWKPGLRIYELTDVTVEVREPDARAGTTACEPPEEGRA
ncbi:type I polyketide synthase [Actinoalloteichus spitiensis]|uniref:type I polyketide synthase n=1 Tax=Actinoalloteichus spitiensis TaxID=252394 RepID=UPI000377E0F6|nr:type I polyketide synthase [Actinoalloteichus spitiensis]